jgi:hypothetical protein
VGHKNGVFPSKFPNKFLIEFLPPPPIGCYVCRPSHPLLFDSAIISGEQKQYGASHYLILTSLLYVCLPYVHVFPSTLCSSFDGKDLSFTAVQKVVIVVYLIFTFWIRDGKTKECEVNGVKHSLNSICS